MKNDIHRRQLAKALPYARLEELPPRVQDQLCHLSSSVPNVLVMYYGGTLAMKPDSSGHEIPTDDAKEILDPLRAKGLDEEMNVVWFQVTDHAIDSTNGRWPHWVTLGNAIRLTHDLFYGFGIVGGTDTKSYLLAALRYMFPNIGKPIICTGSQRSIFKQGDDATRNLYFALKAAVSDLSGAHLAFADVLRHGGHAFKIKDRAFAAFDCPPEKILGTFDGEVRLHPSAPRRNPLVTQARLEFQPQFREGVKIIPISPATPSESIIYDAQDPLCDALLLLTFGAGNVRNEGILDDEQTHVEILRMLHERRYPAVLGSPMMDGAVDSPYKAGADAVDPNQGAAISGGDTTGSSLQVKMMRCLELAWDEASDSLDYDRFRREMQRNHVGELTINLKTPADDSLWFSTKRPLIDK